MTWLRERMKIFIWITAIAFIVPFVAGTLIRNFMGPQGPRGTLATVNGQSITVESYQSIYDRIREQRRKNSENPLTSEDLDRLRRRAFKQAVNQALMQQILEQEGVEATESEIRQMFARSPMFRNKQGKINKRAVQRALRQLPEQRRQQIERSSRRRIESVRMSQWLATHVDVTDSEARLLMKEGLRELNLYGLYLDPRRFVDAERVKTFYEQNREQYRKAPRALVRHILLRADTGTRQTANQLNEIKRKIQTIRRRFKAGDGFSELARQFSEDTSTAQQGGSLGWVTPDELDTSFANEVFGGDTGSLTNLIRTDRGYHIAYVEDGPKITYKDLSQVEDKIRGQLLSDTHWAQARQKIKKLRQQIASSSTPRETLQELALAHSHSSFASNRAGHYGWVPTTFILPSRHPNANVWRDELANDNVIKPKISRTLALLEPGRVSTIVRSDQGFHVFIARASQSANLETLSDTNARSLTRRLQSRKKAAYHNAWLRKQRTEATIELNVPKSRIGGHIPWEK